MKLEATFYGIRCDACGRVLPNEYNYDMYLDDAHEVDYIAKESGWLVTNDGHHYCEECISLNDDDCWETKNGKVYTYSGEVKEEKK